MRHNSVTGPGYADLDLSGEKETKIFTVARGNERVGAKAAAGSGQAARGVGYDAARRQHGEIEEVAAVQRQLLHRGLSITWPTVIVSASIWEAVLSTCTVSPAVATASFIFTVTIWSTSSVTFCTV